MEDRSEPFVVAFTAFAKLCIRGGGNEKVSLMELHCSFLDWLQVQLSLANHLLLF